MTDTELAARIRQITGQEPDDEKAESGLLTRTEMLQETIDELAALGWRAVVHGPEIHLALPLALLAVGLLVLFGGRRK